MELRLRQEVGELERAEDALLVLTTDGVLVEHDVPAFVRELGGPRPRPVGPRDFEAAAPAHAIELAVGDRVGRYELAQPDEVRRRERLVASQVVCLGDEVEQPLRVACLQRCHAL